MTRLMPPVRYVSAKDSNWAFKAMCIVGGSRSSLFGPPACYAGWVVRSVVGATLSGWRRRPVGREWAAVSGGRRVCPGRLARAWRRHVAYVHAGRRAGWGRARAAGVGDRLPPAGVLPGRNRPAHRLAGSDADRAVLRHPG